MKRALSLILAIVLVLGNLAVPSFAAGSGEKQVTFDFSGGGTEISQGRLTTSSDGITVEAADGNLGYENGSLLLLGNGLPSSLYISCEESRRISKIEVYDGYFEEYAVFCGFGYYYNGGTASENSYVLNVNGSASGSGYAYDATGHVESYTAPEDLAVTSVGFSLERGNAEYFVLVSKIVVTYIEVPAAEEFPLWVGGVTVTDMNCGDILGDGSASYDPEKATLYLSGSDITGGHPYDGEKYGIFYSGDSAIEVNISGENRISGENVDSGIGFAKKKIIMTGDGSLAIECPKHGIRAISDDITIEKISVDIKTGDCAVDAYGAVSLSGVTGYISSTDCGIKGNNYWADLEDCGLEIHTRSYGISAYTYVVINDSVIDIESAETGAVDAYEEILASGSDITAKGYYEGLYGDEGVCLTGCRLDIGSSGECGIYADYGIEIENCTGTVSSNAKDALYSDCGTTITGSCLTITSLNGTGIFVEDEDEGTVTLAENDMTIRSKNAGIDAVSVDITGGKLTVDSFGDDYEAVFAEYISISAGAVVTAKSKSRAFYEEPDYPDYPNAAVDFGSSEETAVRNMTPDEAYDRDDEYYWCEYVKIHPLRKYGLWVDGICADDENSGDILGDGTASYDTETNTLFLDGAVIGSGKTRKIDGYDESVGILYTGEDKLRVVLSGTNIISGSDVDYGIYSANSGLCIEGGKLSINSVWSAIEVYSGILEITDSEIEIDGFGSDMICADGIDISGTAVSIVNPAEWPYLGTGINGKAVTMTDCGMDIRAYYAGIIGEASVYMKNCTGTMTDALYGIDCDGDISLSECDGLDIIAYSRAISAYGKLLIEDGKIRARATGTDSDYAIYADSIRITGRAKVHADSLGSSMSCEPDLSGYQYPTADYGTDPWFFIWGDDLTEPSEDDYYTYDSIDIYSLEKYDLWVNGFRMTEKYCDSMPLSEGYASYDTATNTLTLSGSVISFGYPAEIRGGDEGLLAGILYMGTEKLTIVLSGTNTIAGESGYPDYGPAFGILSLGADVEIQGGKLVMDDIMCGIYVFEGDLAVRDSDMDITVLGDVAVGASNVDISGTALSVVNQCETYNYCISTDGKGCITMTDCENMVFSSNFVSIMTKDIYMYNCSGSLTGSLASIIATNDATLKNCDGLSVIGSAVAMVGHNRVAIEGGDVYAEATGLEGESGEWPEDYCLAIMGENSFIVKDAVVTMKSYYTATNCAPDLSEYPDALVDYGDDEESAVKNADPGDCPEYYLSKYVKIHPGVDVYEITATDAVYDGLPHGATVLVNGEETDTDVSYSGTKADGTEYETTTDAPVDAGTYTAAVMSGTDVLTSTSYKIDPRVAELSWTGTDFVYDGKGHVPTASVTNLATDSDVVNVTVIATETDAGEYVATATSLDNPNYTLESATDTETDWKIERRQARLVPLKSQGKTRGRKDGTLMYRIEKVDGVEESGLAEGDELNGKLNREEGEMNGRYYYDFDELIEMNPNYDFVEIDDDEYFEIRNVNDAYEIYIPAHTAPDEKEEDNPETGAPVLSVIPMAVVSLAALTVLRKA